jgi:hypothetical protein
MSDEDRKRRIVITGAAGRVGVVLRAHFDSLAGYELVLLDHESRGDPAIRQAELSRYDPEWAELFAGADAVLHLAGNPGRIWTPWPELLADNVEATLNVFRAAVRHGVRRVIYASSLQTMEGYRYDTEPIVTTAPPRVVSPYGVTKLMSETIARHFADAHDISSICLRLGSPQSESRPPRPNWPAWRHSKCVSEEAMCQAFERAILVEDVHFAALLLVSDNESMRWDLSETRRVLGYTPTGGAPAPSPPLSVRIRSAFGKVQRRLFDPIWQHYMKPRD